MSKEKSDLIDKSTCTSSNKDVMQILLEDLHD